VSKSMSKTEFIESLRYRLRRLPTDEIENAVSFYAEYLSDAERAQNEASAIEALGSPAACAAKIIGEYSLIEADVPRKERKKSLSMFTVIAAMFATPAVLPLGIAVLAVIFTVFATLLAVGAAGVGVTATGAAVTILGIVAFEYGTATGLFYTGIGLFTAAVGLMLTGAAKRSGRGVVAAIRIILGRIIIKRSRIKHTVNRAEITEQPIIHQSKGEIANG